MAERSLVLIRLQSAWLPPSAAWAEGLTAKLPKEMIDALTSGAFAAGDETARAMAAAISVTLRRRQAFLRRSIAATRLPISYRRIPGPVRQMLGRAAGRVQRHRQGSWADFPGWPLDLSSDIAADLSAASSTRAEITPVLLTHDIDSPEGLTNLLRLFLPIEEEIGARSANFIVPCAWPVDHGLVSEVMRRGHEIGVHGYDHSGITSFTSPGERAKRIARGRTFGDRYQAAGYRAPSLIRSRQLLTELDNHYLYDSSIPTSGGPFPAPNNGCASARPWQIGTLWEIPLSLPRDGSLRFLGYNSAQIADMWLRLSKVIGRAGGVVTLLTHCERAFSGNPSMLRAYRNFVERIATDDRFVFLRPADLVSSLPQLR